MEFWVSRFRRKSFQSEFQYLRSSTKMFRKLKPKIMTKLVEVIFHFKLSSLFAQLIIFFENLLKIFWKCYLLPQQFYKCFFQSRLRLCLHFIVAIEKIFFVSKKFTLWSMVAFFNKTSCHFFAFLLSKEMGWLAWSDSFLGFNEADKNESCWDITLRLKETNRYFILLFFLNVLAFLFFPLFQCLSKRVLHLCHNKLENSFATCRLQKMLKIEAKINWNKN